MQADAVDRIVAQWERERPDLDPAPMALIGRLKRASALMQVELEKGFAECGLAMWEFDMLATLRRSGEPYCLAPTVLFSALMVTSGTMTHRLKQLEKRALVARLDNPQDARSKLVQLTPDGLALIDRAVEVHLDNERRILAALSDSEQSGIDQSLRLLLAKLEAEE